MINRWVLGPDANSLPAPMTVQNIRDGSSNTALQDGIIRPKGLKLS